MPHDLKPIGPMPSQAALLDYLRAHTGVPSDSALARRLGLTAPAISKLRNGRINVSAGMVLRIVDKTSLPLADVRAQVAER